MRRVHIMFSNRYGAKVSTASPKYSDKGTLVGGEPMFEKITRPMVWKEIEAAELAVLDELGARVQVTDFQYETLKQWLEVRQDTPHIVISNLGPDDLARKYDDRIVSRLCAGTVVDLSGLADRRQAKEA